MMTATVISDGNHQAISIPQEMQTERKEFIIRKVGEGDLLFPVDDPWYPLRLSIGQMSDDFMEKSGQPTWAEVSEREEF